MSETGMIACSVCACQDWIACAPGTEAEDALQGNLFVLHPAPEIPLRAWCVEHLPNIVREDPP